MNEPDISVITYIYLAVAALLFGIVLVFVVILLTQYWGIDISTNIWLLAIPLVLAVGLNILLIEIWTRYKNK